jgi:hypothetical protein
MKALDGGPLPPNLPAAQATDKARDLCDKIVSLPSEEVRASVLNAAYGADMVLPDSDHFCTSLMPFAALDGRPYPVEPSDDGMRSITEADLVRYKPSPKKISFTRTPKRLGQDVRSRR